MPQHRQCTQFTRPSTLAGSSPRAQQTNKLSQNEKRSHGSTKHHRSATGASVENGMETYNAGRNAGTQCGDGQKKRTEAALISAHQRAEATTLTMRPCPVWLALSGSTTTTLPVGTVAPRIACSALIRGLGRRFLAHPRLLGRGGPPCPAPPCPVPPRNCRALSRPLWSS